MLKHKLLWTVLALILAAGTFFTLSHAAIAAPSLPSGSSLIGHQDRNGHLVLNSGVLPVANVVSPKFGRLQCSNPAYLKLYTDNGADIICFGGKGYSGGVNIYNTGDIYTGNNNTTIHWDWTDSKGTHFETFNLTNLWTDYPAWVISGASSNQHFAFLPHINGIVIN